MPGLQGLPTLASKLVTLYCQFLCLVLEAFKVPGDREKLCAIFAQTLCQLDSVGPSVREVKLLNKGGQARLLRLGLTDGRSLVRKSFPVTWSQLEGARQESIVEVCGLEVAYAALGILCPDYLPNQLLRAQGVRLGYNAGEHRDQRVYVEIDYALMDMDVGKYIDTVLHVVQPDTSMRVLNAQQGRTIYSIAVQMSEGVARMHNAGSIHGDLKPENILLMLKADRCNDVEPVTVADAGNATLCDEDGYSYTARAGTCGYMREDTFKALMFKGSTTLHLSEDIVAWSVIVMDMCMGRQAAQVFNDTPALAELLAMGKATTADSLGSEATNMLIHLVALQQQGLGANALYALVITACRARLLLPGYDSMHALQQRLREHCLPALERWEAQAACSSSEGTSYPVVMLHPEVALLSNANVSTNTSSSAGDGSSSQDEDSMSVVELSCDVPVDNDDSRRLSSSEEGVHPYGSDMGSGEDGDPSQAGDAAVFHVNHIMLQLQPVPLQLESLQLDCCLPPSLNSSSASEEELSDEEDEQLSAEFVEELHATDEEDVSDADDGSVMSFDDGTRLGPHVKGCYAINGDLKSVQGDSTSKSEPFLRTMSSLTSSSGRSSAGSDVMGHTELSHTNTGLNLEDGVMQPYNGAIVTYHSVESSFMSGNDHGSIGSDTIELDGHTGMLSMDSNMAACVVECDNLHMPGKEHGNYVNDANATQGPSNEGSLCVLTELDCADPGVESMSNMRSGSALVHSSNVLLDTDDNNTAGWLPHAYNKSSSSDLVGSFSMVERGSQRGKHDVGTSGKISPQVARTSYVVVYNAMYVLDPVQHDAAVHVARSAEVDGKHAKKPTIAEATIVSSVHLGTHMHDASSASSPAAAVLPAWPAVSNVDAAHINTMSMWGAVQPTAGNQSVQDGAWEIFEDDTIASAGSGPHMSVDVLMPTQSWDARGMASISAEETGAAAAKGSHGAVNQDTDTIPANWSTSVSAEQNAEQAAGTTHDQIAIDIDCTLVSGQASTLASTITLTSQVGGAGKGMAGMPASIAAGTGMPEAAHTVHAEAGSVQGPSHMHRAPAPRTLSPPPPRVLKHTSPTTTQTEQATAQQRQRHSLRPAASSRIMAVPPHAGPATMAAPSHSLLPPARNVLALSNEIEPCPQVIVSPKSHSQHEQWDMFALEEHTPSKPSLLKRSARWLKKRGSKFVKALKGNQDAREGAGSNCLPQYLGYSADPFDCWDRMHRRLGYKCARVNEPSEEKRKVDDAV